MGMGIETATNKDKMPVSFVRQYLKARGYKETNEVWCNDCDEGFIRVEHPIRWLWEHTKQGHEPSFDCCHCWNRQVGRDTGVIEEWYRWFTFRWCGKYGLWLVTDTYQGCEGYEEESPPEWWRSVIGTPIGSYQTLTWAKYEKEKERQAVMP